MIPQDFAWRTRKQWNEFDSIKRQCFEPTPEEIEQEATAQEFFRQQMILQKFSARWITIPETITKEWILDVMDWLDAKQFLGEDLNWYIDNQLEMLWSLEKVIDNLVLTYL